MEIVPIIDLLNFPAESRKLLASCEEIGCFRVINHGIPKELQAEMREAAKSYFNLPSDVKNLKNMNRGSRSTAHSELTPYLETFGVQNTAYPAEIDALCTELKVSSQHKEVIKSYASKAHALAADIAGKIAASMGLDGCSFEEWSGTLRPNIYRFTEQTIGSTGVVLHTDSVLLSLLLEDESVGGLEVMDKSDTLVTVDPVPGSFLVILGDTAKAWSNGRLKNAKHRVICKVGATRVTIPLFLMPAKDANVEAPAAFVDSEHPRLYQTFSYENYRKLMISTKSYVGEALSLFAMDQAHDGIMT